jgi:hypothetical protein
MKTVLFTVAALLFSVNAMADDTISPYDVCPAAIAGNAELIGNQIDKSLAKKDVEEAAAMATICADFGSNIDVSLISPVADAFDKALAGKLKADEKAVMMRFIKACEDKGEKSGGSLGRAGGAHCMLKVYSGFYAGVKKWQN